MVVSNSVNLSNTEFRIPVINKRKKETIAEIEGRISHLNILRDFQAVFKNKTEMMILYLNNIDLLKFGKQDECVIIVTFRTSFIES